MNTNWIAGLIFFIIHCLESKDLPCREAMFKVAYTGNWIGKTEKKIQVHSKFTIAVAFAIILQKNACV